MSYSFEYNGPSSRPRWVRTITDADGVVHKIVLNFGNEEERGSLSTAQIYHHLDNLIEYIKDISQEISPIQLDEKTTDGWHFNGRWGEVEWAKEETLRWWESVYYKDEQDEEIV